MARRWVTACALVLIGASAVTMLQAKANDVSPALFFVTGAGVGDATLEALAQDANLRLEIATRAAGAMLGAIAVSVIGRGGDTVLDAAFAGPWLIARLPPGRYRVVVDDGERRQEQSVWLTGNALRTLRFVW